jgi:hypothetical protein
MIQEGIERIRAESSLKIAGLGGIRLRNVLFCGLQVLELEP